MSASREDSSKRLRLMVVKGSESCRVSLTENHESRVELQIEGAPALAQVVRDTLVVLAPDSELGAPIEQRLQHLAVVVRERLKGLQLEVYDLPDGDMEVQFEMDMETGRVIGKSTALHRFAQNSPDLSRRIHEATKTVFRKDAMELTSELEHLTAEGEHEAAANAVMKAGAGLAFHAGIDTTMLEALRNIDISQLSGLARRTVLERRVGASASLGRYVDAESDVAELLKEQDLTDEWKVSLQNALGIAAAQKGQSETALSIWRKLLKQHEIIHPADRGWMWRNVSTTLAPRNPDAMKAARQSADAFLEAGEKLEAARSLMLLSKLLEHESAERALEQLALMLTFIGEQGLKSAQLLAGVHHARGNRLRELRNHPLALQAALDAVKLLRGVMGLEAELLSSLNLAHMEAEASGNTELAAELEHEAKQLESLTGNTHFALGRRIVELHENYSPTSAKQLLAEARAQGNPELVAGVRTINAVVQPGLDATARLQELESVLSELNSSSSGGSATEPVLLAISQVLASEGEYERAADWLRKLLALNPLHLDARDRLINLLWLSNDWGGAATFLADVLKRHGEAPGLLFAYGKSLLQAGNASAALTTLQKCLNRSDLPDHVRKAAMELRERALNLGGQLTPTVKESIPGGAVLREEIGEALQDFSRFISADKRMVFWTPPENGKDYTWVERPESRAQDLLHTFLKARFQHRISVYEEISTGAGRLDILLRVEGGLSVIIELKMCGFRYSSTYAASGEEQIRHYMENRDARLGYLVVHDARLEGYGSPLLKSNGDAQNTIYEVLVDVRPRVSSRKKAAAKPRPNNSA